jgi:DNA-binding MarR family transcriptional regulator
MILEAKAKKKEMQISELHKLLAVEKSTTTRLVNPLIQKGLLRREKAQHDSRAATLILTEDGKKIHQQVSLCLSGFFQKVTQNIPQDKKPQILDAIRVFIEAIKNSVADYNCCN